MPIHNTDLYYDSYDRAHPKVGFLKIWWSLLHLGKSNFFEEKNRTRSKMLDGEMVNAFIHWVQKDKLMSEE